MQESGAHFAPTEGATTPETLRYQGLCADGTLESSGIFRPLTEGTSVDYVIQLNDQTATAVRRKRRTRVAKRRSLVWRERNNLYNISGITDRGGFPAPAGRLELCVIYG